MRIFIPTLIAATLIAPALSAQITLNAASYNATNIGVDTVKTTTAASIYPNLHAAASATWDMTVVTDSSALIPVYRVASNDTTQFADSNMYSFAGFPFIANVQSSILANNIVEYSEHINRQAFHPTGAGIQTGDSVIVNAQDMAYSSPRIKIAFPATYQTNWMSTYNDDLDMTLTVALLSLSNAPAIVRSYIVEKDTVVGWGTMRVQDASGNASGYMDVLQIDAVTTSTDSFFVNGAPASTLVLAGLQVSQGQVTTSYEQYYYRPMELTALADVKFTDDTYNTPSSAKTHVQRLAQPSSVANTSNETGITIYPNPVSGNVISVDLPAASGSWAYELINMSGQTVSANAIAVSANQTHTQISLSSRLTPGIYYLRLKNNNNTTYVRSIDIIK